MMFSQPLFVTMAKQKALDARLAKAEERGVRARYAAVTQLERNAADGLFAKPSFVKIEEGSVVVSIFPHIYLKNMFDVFLSKCILRSARIKQLPAAQY